MRMRTIFSGLIGIAVGMLVGCGGGGGGTTTPDNINPYSGVTTPAAISVGNAENFGVATTETLLQGVAAEENPFGVVITDGSFATLSLRQIGEIMRRILNDLPQNSNLPTGLVLTSDQLNADADFGESWFCGGSITLPDNYLTVDSVTATFNNLCFDNGSGIGQVILNGAIHYNDTVSATEKVYTITYTNFTVNYNGQTQTLNGTGICVYTISTDQEVCTSTSNYVGSDGLTYQTEDVDVTGNALSGYFVSARIYHPTYGYVSVMTNVAITFCSSGNPGSGEISFTGSGGTWGTITFDSCIAYTITYGNSDGVIDTILGTW